MLNVTLSEQDWQRVLNLIGTKNLWVDCNDILMKIGQQVQQQTNSKQTTNTQEVPGNSGEVVSSRAN